MYKSQRVRNPLIWSHVRANRRLRQSDINMTPIMNLFILLIPFLLMSATFVELSIIQSALSELAAAGAGDGSSNKLTLQAVVEIGRKNYVIKSDSCDLNHLLSKSEARPGSGSYATKGHNRYELTRVLRRIKSFFPEEDSLSLAPEPATPYQLVIDTLDSIREYKVGDKERQRLFPNVSFVNRYFEQ